MVRTRLHSLLGVCFFLLFFLQLNAQDNLSVNFSPPSFLNICGDPDEESVTVSVNGLSTQTRSNIVATANLFSGVQFVSLNTTLSSPGVSLTDNSDPGNPVFSLPDLSPSGTSSVDIVFSVRANCAYTDTLAANDALEAFDTWDLVYDIGSNIGLSEWEGDLNNSYRGAFAIPFMAISVPANTGPFRVGECATRTITASNGGLNGFLDTLIYTNIQGPGVSVSTISVNGISIPFSKNVDLNGDTVLSAVIEGSFFNGNTIGGGPGNNDIFLDPNEVVTIEEQLCILSCTDNRQSLHSVSWGCDGQFCDVSQMASFARIGDGAANMNFTNSGSLPNVNVGYCQSGQTTYTISNDGVDIDAGFGAMIDVAFGIVLGNDLTSENNFAITGVRIAGIDIASPNPLNALNGNALFLVDPDGAGGLDDVDLDGYFDDLPVGESVELTGFFSFDCLNTQESGDNCANDFSTTLKAKAAYDNACGDPFDETVISIQSPSNRNSFFENCATPDAFLNVDTFYIEHTEERNVRFFDRNCGGADELILRVALPTGINPILSETSFTINGAASSVPVLSSGITNDTLEIVYDAGSVAELDGNYDVILAFQADCGAIPGPSIIPVEIEYYCPGCDCRHLWYCDDIPGPQLHATNPPCAPAVVPVCNIGIQTTGFEANRTSFGFTDNTLTTRITPENANTKVAITCDTVEMNIKNIVGNTVLTDSIGMQISYTNLDGSNAPEHSFLFGRATVRINQGGTDYFCTLNGSDTTTLIQDSLKIIRFDLHNCLVGLGISLNPGDSIDFSAYFTVNPDGPILNNFRKVPNLRGHGFAIVDGVEYACDDFGDVITLAKNQTSFDYPRNNGTSNTFPIGCDESFLDYRLVPNLNGYDGFFTNEYRRVVGIDSISFTFDPELVNGFSAFEPSVSFPGHPTLGSSFMALPPFSDFPDGNYIARFDTMSYMPTFNDGAPYAFIFRIRAVPDCKSSTSSSSGNDQYELDPTIYFRDNYFASTLGDGSCSEEQEITIDNDLFYKEPPSFSFFATSNPNYTLFADTAVWEVQHCNTSFIADAGITWLAVEGAGGIIQVVSIEDISDPNNPVSLTVSSYGASNENYFAFTPQLLRADGTNTQTDICNTLRIKALVGQCGTTDFISRVGWNCTPYSDPSWNPEDYPPCTDLISNLSVTSQDAFLDAVEIDAPVVNADLCDTSYVTILVRNTDVGSAFDLKSQLIIPLEGATFVPGILEFAYPSGAAFSPVATDPIANGSTQRGLIYQYDDFSNLNSFLDLNGLPGFNPSNPTDSNEFKIRFGFTTDCDFRSGSIAYYNFQGIKGCQDSTNIDAGESAPIYVNGAEPNPNKSFSIAVSNNPLLLPDGTGTIELTATNLTNSPSDLGDLVSVKIPMDVNYVPASSTVVQPGSWVIAEPTIEIVSGIKMLHWNLPVGLLLNDQATFSFDLDLPTYDCDVNSIAMTIATLTSTTVNCDNGGISCMIELISSNNGEESILVPVGQRILDIVPDLVSSSCLNATQEEVTVSGNIVNSNVDFPAIPFVVHYYHDANANGTLDGGEVEINSFTENGPISGGAAMTFSHSFTTDENQLCNILARIDTIGLGLCQIEEEALPQAQLLNAGNDEVFCTVSPTSINRQLGDSNCNIPVGYTFNWTAIAPATTADLSATNVPDPDLSVPHDGLIQDTLRYILETGRPSCATSTRDTISIIRAVGITLDAGPTVYVEPGDSAVLSPSISGGVGPLTYSWSPSTDLDDPNIANPTTKPTADMDYILTVVNASGCSAQTTVQVRIGAPCIPATLNSITITEPDCGSNEGTAVLALLEDESNYSYQWIPDIGTPIANGNGRSDLPFGAYSVNIVDNSDVNCVATANFIIENTNGPIAAVSSTSPATCSAADGTASLFPAGFNYVWSDGGSGSSRTDLKAGRYTVVFNDPADVNCQNILQLEIEEANPLQANVIVNTYPGCGLNNGSVTINVTGGSGSYNYSWASGTDTETSLLPGPYVVTVSDNAGANCNLEVFFILRNDAETAAINITADTVNITCAGDADGSVNFSVNYDAGFVNPADTVITNGVDFFINGQLPPGDYCVYVEDANDCISGEACFKVLEPDSMYLIIIKKDACGNGGDIEVNPQGGTGPYTFDWTDLSGSDNGASRNALTDGAYNIAVQDAGGCSVSETVNIEPCICSEPELISVSIIKPSCGESNGSVNINLAQEEADYTFDWAPDLGTASGIGNIRGDLPFGTYSVTISHTGATDCSSGIIFLVKNIDGPETSIDSIGLATCSSADGYARLEPAAYTYNWSDGGSGAVRNDLAAGIHYVTFSDPADPSCENIEEVEIGSFNPLQASAQIDVFPGCGASDGTVTINVNGGSGDYNYSWSSGTATQSGLAAGLHTITISENNGNGCELSYSFILPNIETATISLTADTVQLSCAGSTVGLVDFTVAYDPAFVFPADTVFVDSAGVVSNGSLSPGNYCLYIEDNNNCIAGGACFTVVEPDSLYFIFEIETACDSLGKIDVSVQGGTPPINYNWADIAGSMNEEDRDSLQEGSFSLSIEDGSGCTLSETAVIVPPCRETCDYFYGMDTIIVDGCGGIGDLCFDILLPDTNLYVFTVNGLPYSGNFGGCFESTGSYSYADLFGGGELGPYLLNNWTVNDTSFTGEFQDIVGFVDSLNTWDTIGNWQLDVSLKIIFGGSPDNSYSSIEIEKESVNVVSTLGFNSRQVPFGVFLSLPPGEHLVTISSIPTGCEDIVIAQVLCDQAEDVIDTIFITETLTHCIDTALVGINDEVASITNICPEASTESVAFTVDSVLCVSYEGVRLGTDTACYEICDITGTCDTINFIVTVINLPPDLVTDTIFVNETIEYCLDTSIFTGEIEIFENFCQNESTGAVEFLLNPDTYCVEYTGLDLAKDTACVVICDDLGYCDTTFFCITVEEYLNPPLAVDDYDTTAIGTPVVIDIKANDITFGGIDTAYLLTDPLYGTATLNPDCSVTYNASDEYCEREDVFSYVICNPNGCDTADVYVFIECVDIFVFTAISPNRDGVNDFLFISGIEDYPESELEIYNRWGNKVYETKAYKNDWRGTWNGNKDLPDGTYYYLLRLNDEASRVFSGYLEIYR